MVGGGGGGGGGVALPARSVGAVRRLLFSISSQPVLRLDYPHPIKLKGKGLPGL